MTSSIKQFGTVVMSLSDLAKDFSIEQGNSNQNHVIKNLVHARWVWQELFLQSIWAIKQKVVKVNPDHTITLPNDLMLLVNISIEDECGQLRPLGHNPNLNTLKECEPTCSCKCGGTDTLCATLENIQVRTETINIDGQDYTKTIWNRTDGAGNLVEVVTSPIWNQETTAVEMDTSSRILCALEVNEAGCIKATKPNMQLMKEYCGCYVPSLCQEACRLSSPLSTGKFGDYNWDAVAKDTVHLNKVTATHVIIGYKTSGECPGEEIMIPRYAEFAMKTGIINRQKALSPISTVAEQTRAERNYDRARTKLRQLLNPIPIRVLSELHDEIPKW